MNKITANFDQHGQLLDVMSISQQAPDLSDETRQFHKNLAEKYRQNLDKIDSFAYHLDIFDNIYEETKGRELKPVLRWV